MARKIEFHTLRLGGFEPEIEIEDQSCSVGVMFTEEFTGEDGAFSHAAVCDIDYKMMLAHPDLVSAWLKFSPHLCFMSEYMPVKDQARLRRADLEEIFSDNPPGFYKRFLVKKIKFWGAAEKFEILIEGELKLNSGNYLAIKSPKIKPDDLAPEDQLYIFRDLLSDHLAELEDRFRDFILRGVCKPQPQLSLFDAAGEPPADPFETGVGA